MVCGAAGEGHELKKWWLVFAVLFSVGAVAGAGSLLSPFTERCAGAAAEIVSAAGSVPGWQGSALAFLLIFGKNVFVAVLATLAGTKIYGLFPVMVCLVNGLVVGAVAREAAAYISPAAIFAGFAVHGVPELAALFLVCGHAAKLAWSKEKVEQKEKFAVFKYALPILLAAAALEVFVTPAVMEKLAIW